MDDDVRSELEALRAYMDQIARQQQELATAVVTMATILQLASAGRPLRVIR